VLKRGAIPTFHNMGSKIADLVRVPWTSKLAELATLF